MFLQVPFLSLLFLCDTKKFLLHFSPFPDVSFPAVAHLCPFAAANCVFLLQGWGLLGPRNELFDAAKYRLLADQLGCPDERWCSEGKWRSKSGPSLADLSTCWRRMEPDDSIQPMEQGRMPKAMRREELEEGELEEGELEEGELEEEAIDVSDYLPMAHQDARTSGRDAR